MNVSNVTTKRLTMKDVGAMRHVNALFADVFQMPDEYLGKQPTDDYLRNWLADTHNIALVAMQDDVVVGALAGYLLQKFEQQRSELFVYDLAVRKDLQRLGVGTKLMQAVRIEARKLGAYVVFLEADFDDIDAIAFYRSLKPTEDSSAQHFDFEV